MPRIPQTEYESNGEVLEKIEAKWKSILNNRGRQLKFLGLITSKEGLENLIFTMYIEGRRRKHVPYIVNLDIGIMFKTNNKKTVNY